MLGYNNHVTIRVLDQASLLCLSKKKKKGGITLMLHDSLMFTIQYQACAELMFF